MAANRGKGIGGRGQAHPVILLLGKEKTSSLHLKCDGTRAETRFRL